MSSPEKTLITIAVALGAMAIMAGIRAIATVPSWNTAPTMPPDDDVPSATDTDEPPLDDAKKHDLCRRLGDAILSADSSQIHEVLLSFDILPGQLTRVAQLSFAVAVGQLVSEGFDASDPTIGSTIATAQRALPITDAMARWFILSAATRRYQADIDEAVADSRSGRDRLREITRELVAHEQNMALPFGVFRDLLRTIEVELWAFGDLPTVDAPVVLKADETCHVVLHTDWQELRSINTRMGYAGLSASIPIVSGVRYRIGNVQPLTTSQIELRTVDQGTLILTSTRLIFVGQLGTKSFAWASVLSITPFVDAIQFTRATGKHPFFPIYDGDLLAALATAIATKVR